MIENKWSEENYVYYANFSLVYDSFWYTVDMVRLVDFADLILVV